MAISLAAMTAEQLAAYLAAASQYETVAQAIAQGGFYILETGEVASTALTVTGGAASAVYGTGTALELAAQAQLAATGTGVTTSGIALAQGTGGLVQLGATSLSLSTVASVVGPIAGGVALGYDLYTSNPQLWTKLSQKLLPFCYPGTTDIPAWIDVAQETGAYKLLVKLGIIDAVKELIEEEGIGESSDIGDTIYDDDYYGHSTPGTYRVTTTSYGVTWYLDVYSNGPCVILVKAPSSSSGRQCESYVISASQFRANNTGSANYYGTKRTTPSGNVGYYYQTGYLRYPASGVNEIPASTSTTELNNIINSIIDSMATGGTPAPSGYPEGTSEWEGTRIAEPEVYPYPIIVVPDPVGPDYQPVTEPITPITTPIPLPAPTPVEPTEPEPYEPPEEWPEEEPWPVTIPFPWPNPDPEPDPDADPWPEVMPWPLPPELPENWPKSPEKWTWPEELPWPKTPEEWPDQVPWPNSPPDPEEWPEQVPWPATPEEWPEQVPWPVPWPDEWPETAPWPIPWPSTLPYPKTFPKPEPSPDPEKQPDPTEITDPTKQVDPIIRPSPIPYQYPDPYQPVQPTEPTNPYDDPSQPDPKPEPNPYYPKPEDPTTPVPEPPTGVSPTPTPPIVPLPFSSTTGLISVYHPTQSELLAFAQWLWVTWQDATIDKIWNNPFDGVITLFELYCTPTDVGRKNIRSGFLDSGVSSETISRYTEINCGTVGVPEYYGNYLDYAPYTKAYIYLPFIGVVELNSDDIVGHAVNVTYRIDEYNGSCIAQITVAKVTDVNGETVEYSNLFYQYSGNCAVELPIAGGSQAAIKAGMMQAAAYGISSVIGGVISGASSGGLTGALAGLATGAAYGAANAVGSVVSAKSSVQHSGSFGSSYGALGVKIPFITVVRPKQIQVPNYNELYGYQAHKAVNIGDCTGYLRCREVHVISPTASDEEKAQIEQMLKIGVYVTE